jgi:HK97 gp10 family phage protein
MPGLVRLIDRFPELMALANSGTAAALDKAAADIESGAKARSRVDTGTMRGGWTSEKLNNWTRMVYNPVYYTLFNEYGTIYMSAQPMLKPALEEVTPEFIKNVREAWYG